MLATRVIPCLDVDFGRVVKGIKFRDIRDAGDPVELARECAAAFADAVIKMDSINADRLAKAVFS